jgi:hypothetical protein
MVRVAIYRVGFVKTKQHAIILTEVVQMDVRMDGLEKNVTKVSIK